MNIFESTKSVEQWSEQSAWRLVCMGCVLQILARPRLMRNQRNVPGNLETLQMNCLPGLSEKAKTRQLVGKLKQSISSRTAILSQ